MEAQVQGWWTFFLRKNEETGRFYPSDYKAYDEKLLCAQCLHCGQEINGDLLEL